MAQLATFKKLADGSYEGTIHTLTLNVKIRFVEAASGGDNGPSHRAFAGPAEIGAAWQKVSKEGRRYLSVKLDDPTFLAPIYASLLAGDKDDEFDLIWSRHQFD
jgi:uncharacterized protein (DUF736 family)